jgi:RNA polymerase sigma-70 factor, ECF subfamily
MDVGEDRIACLDEEFDQLRPQLFAIAYRMTGPVGDANDLVPEAFLRFARVARDGVEIESPRAYMSTVVTRLAIDSARAARARRETYVGQWLPEPLLTDARAEDPAARAEQADSLSMAFLVVLDRLNPVERAVFLVHDVFGYDHREVAEIVGKSVANCRQLARRARAHLAADRPRFMINPDKLQHLGPVADAWSPVRRRSGTP